METITYSELAREMAEVSVVIHETHPRMSICQSIELAKEKTKEKYKDYKVVEGL